MQPRHNISNFHQLCPSDATAYKCKSSTSFTLKFPSHQNHPFLRQKPSISMDESHRCSVHLAFGGGAVADVLLWKNWFGSAALLIGSTALGPLPPVTNLDISEESVVKAADEMQVWVNRALSTAHDIAIGGKLGLFVQVFLGLWMISYIGGFFNFLTLAYIAVLLSLSLPVLYAKYQKQIDEKLIVAHKIIQTQYRKIDEQILRKIPMPSNNDKKTQ